MPSLPTAMTYCVLPELEPEWALSLLSCFCLWGRRVGVRLLHHNNTESDKTPCKWEMRGRTLQCCPLTLAHILCCVWFGTPASNWPTFPKRVYCCDKDRDQKHQKRIYLSYRLYFFTLESQGGKLKACFRKQFVYCLAPHGLLSLLSYSTQVHLLHERYCAQWDGLSPTHHQLRK